MRYAAYCILAALLAAGVYGAIPQKAEDWYTPSGGKFKTKDSIGTVWYLDENGEEAFIAISVNADGNIVEDYSVFDDLGISMASFEAMRVALKAETIALQNKERIEALGANLDSVFKEMKTESTDDSGGKATGTAKITPGDGKAQVVIAGISPSADGLSLEKTNNTFRIKGWPDIENGSFLAKNNDVVCGEWLRPTNGLDMVANYFSVFGLACWDDPSGSGCSQTLKRLAADSTQANEREKHMLLARHGFTNGVAKLHYLPIGDLMAEFPGVDETSIVTNADTGSGIAQTGRISLAGINENDGCLLLSAADGANHWISTNDLPAAKFPFDGESIVTNVDGVASINGYGLAPTNTVPSKVGDSIEWRKMPTGDGTTIEDHDGILSIVGWDTSPSNKVLYAEWDDENNTNTLKWVDLNFNRCHCPDHCPIHDVDYVNGFCPEDGCPHSQFGFGVSEGNGSENIGDSIIDGI